MMWGVRRGLPWWYWPTLVVALLILLVVPAFGDRGFALFLAAVAVFVSMAVAHWFHGRP